MKTKLLSILFTVAVTVSLFAFTNETVLAATYNYQAADAGWISTSWWGKTFNKGDVVNFTDIREEYPRSFYEEVDGVKTPLKEGAYGTFSYTVKVDGTECIGASYGQIVTFVIPPKYNITYTVGLSGATNPNVTEYRAAELPITLQPASKSGSRFLGWYDNSGFSGSPVTTISSGKTGDLQFYGKWATEYTVYYNKNTATSGTVPGSISSKIVGDTITLSGNTGSLARVGYTFGGWSSNKNATSGKTGSYKLLNSDLDSSKFTFYAVMKPVTLSYNSVNYDKVINNEFNGGALTSGNYYLAEDVTLTQPITVASGQVVNLCLNGKVLKMTGSGSVITNNGTLTITDSNPSQTHTESLPNGGVITGGNAANGGGINNTGTLTLKAGTITGNTATNGGGVYDKGSMTVGGAVKITSNTGGNLYLAKGKTLTVSSDITASTKIGVSTETAPTKGAPVSITAGSSKSYVSNFTSDSASYKIYNIVNGTSNIVKLSVHEHSWKYGTDSSDASALKAWCVEEFGNTYCDNYSESNAQKVNVLAPKRTVYADTAKSEEVTFSASTLGALTLSSSNIKYYKKGETTALASAPVNVGTYLAKATIDTDKTAQIEYSIAKADLAAKHVTLSNLTQTFDGTTKEVTVNAAEGVTGLGTITAHYYDSTSGDEISSPTRAGTYVIKLTMTEGDNFNAATEPVDTGKTLTIEKKVIGLKWTQPESLVYDGTAKAPTVEATGLEGTEECNVTASLTPGKSNVNAGESFTFTATGLTGADAGNYKLPAAANCVSSQYTVTKYKTKLSNIKSSFVYDGAPKGISFKPVSPDDAVDALEQSDFTIKYYKIDENAGTVSTTALTSPSALGQYIYVVTLNAGHNNYEFDSSKTYAALYPSGVSTTAAFDAKASDCVNAGYMIIKGTSDQKPQKPISFSKGEIEVYTTDADVTEPVLTNVNEGASTIYESSNKAVATVTDKGQLTIKGPGKTRITATSRLGDADDVYASYDVIVSKLPINVKVQDKTGAAALTYGDEVPEYSLSYELGVSDYTHIIDKSKISGTATYSGYKQGSGVGEHTITVSGLASETYAITYLPGTVEVKQKELASGNFTVTAKDKIYDGSNYASGKIVVASGKLESDKLGVSYDSASFDTAEVGTEKTVTFTDVELTGTKADNYCIKSDASFTAKADITAMPIEFSFGKSEFSYDGTDKDVSVSARDADGRVFNDFVVKYKSDTYTESTTAPSKVGEYTVTAVLGDNYKVKDGTSNTATLKITKGDIIVFAVDGLNHRFDGTPKSIVARAVPYVGVTVKYYALDSEGVKCDEVTEPKACGNYLYEINLDDEENYEISGTNTGIMTITKNAQPEFVFNKSVVSKTYGDANFTQQVTGGAKDATISYELLEGTEYAEVNATSGEVKIKKPGTAVIKATSVKEGYEDAAANYVVVIGKKEIGIEIDSKAITYTGEAQTAPYKLTGEIAGNPVEESDINFSYVNRNDADDHSNRNVGSYVVAADISAANEYYISELATGIMTIRKADLTVTIEDDAVNYGEEPPKYSYSYTPIGSDAVGCLGGEISYDCDYEKGSDAGSYEIKGSGLTSDNYNIEYADGTLTVNPIEAATADFEFKAPKDLQCDGTEKIASVTAAKGIKGMGEITVKYYSEGEELDGAPTEIGTYSVKIDVAAGTNYKATSDITDSSWKFTIWEKAAVMPMVKGIAGKTSIKYSWTSVPGAAVYKVYQTKCNKKFKLIKTTRKLSYTKKSLLKKTAYKAYVVAFDAKGKKIAKTPIAHNMTKGGNRSNATAVSAKTLVNTSLGKNFNVKAAISKKDSKKTLLWKTHVSAPIRYYSSDYGIAIVDSRGNVTCIGEGYVNIYSVASSGVHAVTTILVTSPVAE